MDDAVVKIERTCVYADVRRLCSEVGRGRNIGLHNLFRLYTDGGKSDASRALYLFETLEGMVEEKMGRLGSGGQLIFHPMYAVGDPPSYFRNDRPPSIRPSCYRIRPDTREIHL